MSFHRLHELSNGEVIDIAKNDKSYLLEYEDKLFYEVQISDLDEFMQPKFKRTGIVFTAEEVNRL